MRGTIALLLLLGVSASSFAAPYQEGNFDPTFGNGGRLLVDVSPDHGDSARRMVLMSSGKLLLGGTCVGTQGASSFFSMCLTQLLPNGSYDGNFGPGGVGYVRFDHFAGLPNNTNLTDMIVLRDGRIALFGVPTDGTQMILVVLRSDGSALDSTVGGGSGFLQLQFGGKSSSPSSLIEQPDGKILLAGEAIGPNSNYDFAVGRLNADISGFDSTFGSEGIQTVAFDLGGPSGDNTDICSAVRLQSDGKIILAGYASGTPTGQEGAFQVSLVRLTTDGVRDTTFGSTGDGRVHYLAGGAAAIAYDARIDARDHIVLGGVFANGTNVQWLVDRLTSDGARDVTFNGGSTLTFLQPPGDASTNTVRLALTNDGIFAIGNTPRSAASMQNYFAVARVNFNGTLDAQFANQGRSYGSFTGTNDFDTTGADLAVGNGGLMIVGEQSLSTDQGYNDVQFGVGRLQYDHVFQYGFD